MATKLSALTALTAAGDDDIFYVGDTADGGSSFTSKRITKANLFNGFATETYVGTQIANLIDSAPGALDTLNELAAAINDDASFATTVTNSIAAETSARSAAITTLTGTVTEIDANADDLIALSGVAEQSTSLGAFSGTTISDNVTIKAALQALETAVESKGSATSLTSLTTAVGDLNTLTGVAQNDTNLGTFTGSTITDNQGIKTAIQQLETAVETKHATGGNINLLTANTSADATPASWKFLAVDCSDGSIKVIDKNFVEVE
jgi:hypothetical protein